MPRFMVTASLVLALQVVCIGGGVSRQSVAIGDGGDRDPATLSF